MTTTPDAALDRIERLETALRRVEEWALDDPAHAQAIARRALGIDPACDHSVRYRELGQALAVCVVCGHEEDADDERIEPGAVTTDGA